MSSEAFERWLAISEQFPVGPKRRRGMLRSAETNGEVAPGQIRQAYWSNSSALVLITDIDDNSAQAKVLPVSVEPGVENRAATVIEAEASPLHGSVTVWPASPEWIPFATLDTTIATIPTALLRLLDQDLAASGTLGIRPGHSDPAGGSGAAMAIDELFDALDALHRAPNLHAETTTAAPAKLGLPLPLIMTTLNVSQPRAMAILIGKEPVTLEEAEQLSIAANKSVEEITAATIPLPYALLRELQEPRLRSHVRSRTEGNDEDRARIRLGYEAYQLAARQTGEGRELWRQRLDAIFAAETP